MDQEQKAKQYIAEAQKFLKNTWIFGGPKNEDAAESYSKAANCYKMAKKWQEAGDAFIEASNLQTKIGNKHEAATEFVNAANCYRKVNPKDACDTLQKAIEIYTDLGRFGIAAKHQKEIAEIYETELVDLEKAIAAYEQAADWFQGEESKTSANNCLLKVALFAAQLEQYEKAVKIYEQIGTASIDVPLMRFSVKDYFFRAGLCTLCTGDVVSAQRALAKYQELDQSFSSTRECTFLKNIITAYEAGDVEQFTNHVIEFDNFMKLDNWKTTILLRIKRSIHEEPSLA
jgi:alpha-soluble NSF attachment protein